MKRMLLLFVLFLSVLLPKSAQAEAPAMRQSSLESNLYGARALEDLRKSHGELFQNFFDNVFEQYRHNQKQHPVYR